MMIIVQHMVHEGYDAFKPFSARDMIFFSYIRQVIIIISVT